MGTPGEQLAEPEEDPLLASGFHCFRTMEIQWLATETVCILLSATAFYEVVPHLPVLVTRQRTFSSMVLRGNIRGCYRVVAVSLKDGRYLKSIFYLPEGTDDIFHINLLKQGDIL